MADQYEDDERRWRGTDRGNEWDDRSRFGGSYNRGYGRQMDNENLRGNPTYQGRSFNRQWYDQDRWDRVGQGEWDYEGPYYNRGVFNDWEMERDYSQDEPHEYSGRGYGYGRDFNRSMGRDYGRGSFNRDRRGFFDPLNRGWRSRDANLEYFGRSYGSRGYSLNWEMEDDWDEEEAEPTYVSYQEWWLVPGPFTGVGPRGYQRSDERILEDVNERLTEHGQIDASDVEVQVQNGEVSLRGTVENRRAKRLAEDIIDDIPGVNDIHNQLRVRQPENRMGPRSEAGQGQQGRQGREGQEVTSG